MNATPPILSLMSTVLKQASSLPAMPEVAVRLLDTLQRDDVTLGHLAEIIACDQALAVKVLRLANSARYSAGRGVGTLQDAAATLGMRSLRDLTLSACLVGVFPEPDGFDRVAFWQGSMATAAYARCWAGPLQQDDDVAWLCGLVLRTGQLLMMQFDPQRAVLAQRITALEVDATMGYERSMMGCSHPDVTAALARHWRFPAALVAALAASADPMEYRPFNRMGAVLRLASVTTDARRLDKPLQGVLPQVQAPLLAHLQLDLVSLDAQLPSWAQVTAGAEDLLH